MADIVIEDNRLAVTIERTDPPEITIQSTPITVTIDAAVGVRGASAYEVAVANGFSGTEEEWLASLQADGAEGVLAVANRLSEFDSQAAKAAARDNLELNTIDLGTFN